MTDLLDTITAVLEDGPARQPADQARAVLAALQGLYVPPPPGSDRDAHRYLSTGCLHGDHGYCQARSGAVGTKTPATCKFCAAPCVCDCHREQQ